ncbi:MAG TPA: Gfo/Idh/MocA family oxidoreductase, partial [Thermoguttaceae bacterium]|nr:Gfo/Idh/MocA family oxidoreductase [Thermoguttaceae bacterium]
MNLTDSAKKIGQENFCAAIAHSAVRREFLKKQVDQNLASGRGLGAYYFGYEPKIKEPLRVGILGTGDEGSVLIGALNPEFIEVKAIADVRPYSVYRAFHGDVYSAAARAARPGLLAKYGWKTEEEGRKHVKVYGRYQELLADAKQLGIEAVIIALPLHLHAPAAIAAMKAGLHVLTEKLMAHSVAECKEMARMAKQTKLILAVGHQRHYNILYDHAVELIRQGVLGDLHYIRAQWHRGNLPGRDSWKQPLPPGAKDLRKYPEENQLAEELAQWEEQYQKLQRELEHLQQTPNRAKEAEAQRKRVEEFLQRLQQKRAQVADREIIAKVGEEGYQEHIVRDAEGKVVGRYAPNVPPEN